MRVSLFIKEITDNVFIRDNFKKLQDAIDKEPTLKAGFQFFEVEVAAAVTKKSYPHNLKFRPRDVIFLSASNEAAITFHYDLFTAQNIVFTASAACTFRCFIGTYAEGVLR